MGANKMAEPIRVLVTGAAGQIAYSLLYSIAKGDVFGHDQPIILVLLDIPPMVPVLDGVVMELQDCALPLLREVIPTSDVEVGFKDLDAAILVGSMPRKEGMERKDLLKANVAIFKTQGSALEKYAKKTVKVLVVGNPANTNCLIASKSAPSIPKENFSCLTRLDHNRASSQVAMRCGVSANHVKNVIIWGNHSSTQYPDVHHAKVTVNGCVRRCPGRCLAQRRLHFNGSATWCSCHQGQEAVQRHECRQGHLRSHERYLVWDQRE